MITEFIRFTGTNGLVLPGRIWTPEHDPCMVLQITHGMTEHIGRYDELARKLTSYGIAVAGFDLRGHGQNKGDRGCASFGENGWRASLHDMYLFYLELESRFAGIPHFMMGFSLGSFLLREYLSRYKEKPCGVVLVGTGKQPGWVLSILMRMVRKEIRSAGFDSQTAFVDKLSLENYNRKFSQNTDYFSWLCSDRGELSIYSTDSLCRFHISAGLFYQILESMKRTGTVKSYRKWDKAMPILLLSGGDDPVGDFGKGVQKVRTDMGKAGMQDIEMYLFSDARHDLFHEKANGEAEEATDTLTAWLFEKNGKIGGSK